MNEWLTLGVPMWRADIRHGRCRSRLLPEPAFHVDVIHETPFGAAARCAVDITRLGAGNDVVQSAPRPDRH